MLSISRKERVFNAMALIKRGISPKKVSEMTGICIETARYLQDNFYEADLDEPTLILPIRILH